MVASGSVWGIVNRHRGIVLRHGFPPSALELAILTRQGFLSNIGRLRKNIAMLAAVNRRSS
jgi:hypothetical protein